MRRRETVARRERGEAVAAPEELGAQTEAKVGRARQVRDGGQVAPRGERRRRRRARRCCRSRGDRSSRCPSPRARCAGSRGRDGRPCGERPRRACPCTRGRRRWIPLRGRGRRRRCRRGPARERPGTSPASRAACAAISARMYDSVNRFDPTRRRPESSAAAHGAIQQDTDRERHEAGGRASVLTPRDPAPRGRRGRRAARRRTRA